jgi:uncharacterized protein
MLLDLSKIRGSREGFAYTYPPGAFTQGDEVYRVVEPLSLAFDVTKDKAHFRLVGRLKTALALPCSRCLEDLTIKVDEPFDVLYLPHSENVGEGEVEVEDDDLSAAFYRNDAIDLGELMREQFYLLLPMKPLCVEACRGLCSQCGTNLNTGTCSCVPPREDGRLAELKRLLPRND